MIFSWFDADYRTKSLLFLPLLTLLVSDVSPRMNRKEKTMRSMFLAAVLLASLAGPVVADECDDYGAQAVAAAEQAKKLGCLGMTSEGWGGGPVSIMGRRFSPNLSDHVNFCRANPRPQWNTTCDGDNCVRQPDAVGDESSLRDRDLLLCVLCNSAATEAVSQTQAAADLKCGFTDPEWDNNSFATQMQACFKGKWYWMIFATMPQTHYDNQDRAKKLAICRQEKAIQAKLSADDSRYTKRPYLKREVPRVRPNAVNDVAADPDCKWCKSTKSSVIGTPQRGGSSAMDRLGDLNNNNNLTSVSGNSGVAQIGRNATPRPTSPKAQPGADAVVRAPTASSTANGGFKSKPIPNPTFNDPNPIR